MLHEVTPSGYSMLYVRSLSDIIDDIFYQSINRNVKANYILTL